MAIKKLMLFVGLFLLNMNAATAAWEWTKFMSIASNYIHPIAQGSMDRVLVLTMNENFHSCGWNAAANINSTIVGEQTFDTLTATFLSAWMANKTVSLLIDSDNCDGSREKVYGIRISK